MPGTARELMRAPIQSVAPSMSLAAARQELERARIDFLPIVQEDCLVGLLRAADVERAVRHGLGGHGVTDVMLAEPPSVPPDAEIPCILDRLKIGGASCVLVVERGKLVGAVMRADLVEYLFEHYGEPSHAASAPTRHVEAAHLLEASWEPDSLELLRTTGRAAGDRPLYLVGGAVRDLLLGRPSYDIDLMVEGDGIAVARELAKVLDAKVKVHEPFKTATLKVAGDRRIDVATARTERYERPGALPEVAPGALLEDLGRRDFTVNALAMRLDPAQWGRIIDPFGGLDDLERGLLRILHPVSFVEDPARIVRGVRFERTLGFAMDPQTERLARLATASGRLDSVGGERLKLELHKILTAPGAAKAIERLADLDALRLLAGALADLPAPTAPLERLDALAPQACLAIAPRRQAAGEALDSRRAAVSEEQLRFRVALALLLTPLEPIELELTLKGLHLAGQDAQAIFMALLQGPHALKHRAHWLEARPSQRYDFLASLTFESLVLVAVLAPDTAAAILEHLALRHFRLEGVDGDWLRSQGVPPGRLLGQILKETRAAALDGAFRGPEEEQAFALGLWRNLQPQKSDR